MLFGLNRFQLQILALSNGGKFLLQLVIFFVLGVFPFFVNGQEAVEFRNGAGGAEGVIGT